MCVESKSSSDNDSIKLLKYHPTIPSSSVAVLAPLGHCSSYVIVVPIYHHLARMARMAEKSEAEGRAKNIAWGGPLRCGMVSTSFPNAVLYQDPEEGVGLFVRIELKLELNLDNKRRRDGIEQTDPVP